MKDYDAYQDSIFKANKNACVNMLHQIENAAAFEQMLISRRAITFLHARWSMYSVQSRKLFREFYHQSHKSAWTLGVGLSYWEIDVSNQSGEIWEMTWTWIESQNVAHTAIMLTGGGAILWSERRAIKETIQSALWLKSLLDSTREAYL